MDDVAVSTILQAIEDSKSAVTGRLDRMNGRVGDHAERLTRVEATMVSTTSCETTRAGCGDRRIIAERSATWRAYLIPTAVGVSVALAVMFIRG